MWGAMRRAPTPPAARPDSLPEPALTLDACGLLCPMPIVKAAVAIREIAVGEVLRVLATDRGIATDMPAWCRAMHHEHLATFEEAGRWSSYVRRRGRPAHAVR
jgi:tRNA 2-thiouridine synthesizing protein A